jgi:hypothetical protein
LIWIGDTLTILAGHAGDEFDRFTIAADTSLACVALAAAVRVVTDAVAARAILIPATRPIAHLPALAGHAEMASRATALVQVEVAIRDAAEVVGALLAFVAGSRVRRADASKAGSAALAEGSIGKGDAGQRRRIAGVAGA